MIIGVLFESDCWLRISQFQIEYEEIQIGNVKYEELTGCVINFALIQGNCRAFRDYLAIFKLFLKVKFL